MKTNCGGFISIYNLVTQVPLHVKRNNVRSVYTCMHIQMWNLCRLSVRLFKSGINYLHISDFDSKILYFIGVISL
jgi:hypothetical protein